MRNKLRALRARHGHTQSSLSELLEMSESSYNRRENEELDFTLRELKMLIEIFSLSKEQVYDIFFED